MLLSIIIPIYKVEKYIRGTLYSIYSQEYDEREFEVICVNDGTPDSSMDIVDEFVRQHDNLHVINQMNQGLSCARNAGLKIAKGNYVWFVDSDDTIAKGSLNQLQDYIKKDDNQTEIWAFNMTRVQESSKNETVERVILKHRNSHLYGKCINKDQLIHKVHIAPVQRFIFKRAFLDNYQLHFYPKILHEDKEFMVKAFFWARKIMLIDYSPYRYLVRTSGSIMSDINMKSVYSKLMIIKSFENYKTFNSHTTQEYIYFNDNAFMMVIDILEMKMQLPEYTQVINENVNSFRFVALRGCVANIFYKDIKKIMKSLLVLISPKLYHIIATHN